MIETQAGCRSCGGTLHPVLDLGSTPLANRLVKAPESTEPTYPLELVFCEDCSLVQLAHTVSPEVMFLDYPYFSSVSDTVVRHAQEHVEELVEELSLASHHRVVELASNDGYLLQFVKAAGVQALGIEPAKNVAAKARAAGIETVSEFFTLALARRLRASGITADVVLGNNVLAHVPDLNGFVAGAAELLTDGGMVEFEFPYVRDLVEHVEFDTIYHEHFCYFSAHAIEALFNRHGLVFADVRRMPLHGGSLRVRGTRRPSPDGRQRVEALLAEERQLGMDRLDWYRAFSKRVWELGVALKAELNALKADGKRIVAYGASAKGSTLLNVFGIGAETLDYVVDRSPAKQGWRTPGTHLEIHPPTRLLEDKPDFALLLTWNFAEEIRSQQAEWCRSGGEFIVPVPTVHRLGAP